MAAGDITKRLTAEIRDILSQAQLGMGKQYGTKSLLKNDFLIYNALDRIQRDFMVFCKTSIGYYTLTLAQRTKTYDLHKRIFRIFSLQPAESNSKLNYSGRYLPITHQIEVLDTEIITGDKLNISAYIKPAASYTEGNTVSVGDPLTDKISDAVDPIIEGDYHDYLIEGVLSDYKTLFPQFRGMAEIKNDVRKLADQLRPAGVMRVQNMTTGMNTLGGS